MSTVSKVVLGVSVGLTLSTVAAVHLNQTWDRERLHEGVVRDLERQDRRKDNLRLLEEQRSLTAQLQEEGAEEEQRSLTAQLQEEQRSLTAQLQEEQGSLTAQLQSSEDQGSVDLSHDQSGDSLTSELEEGGGCEETSFHCDRCHKWIPAAQLRGEQPSYLKGDNFFKFVCSDCSEDGKESFERMRLTWQQVVMLAMYNLSLEGTGRQGYFRWKEDICAFIGRHWNFLLGTRKKTSTWWSTVAGCLSVGSPTFFRSGAQEFGEPGWWKLVQNRPPTLRPDTEKSTTKAKASKPVMEPIITVEGLRKRGARNPVENAIQLKEKRCRTQEAKDIRRAQKEASGGGGGYTDRSASSTPVKLGGGRGGNAGRRPDLVLEKGEVIDFSSLSSLLSEADLIPDAMPPQALFHDDEEMETEGMIDPGMEYLPPPRASLVARKKLRPAAPHIKREAESEDDEGHDEEFEGPVGRREGPSLSAGGCVGAGGPERRRINHPEKADEEPQTPCFSPLSLPNASTGSCWCARPRGSEGSPADVDRAVSTLSLVGGIYGATGTLMRGRLRGKYCTNSQESRILDRFQTNLSSRRGLQQTPVSFCHRLTGAEGSSDLSIKSPYTARILKPYIRRDYESRPVKLRLLEEIRAYPHRKNPNWVPEPNAPIDYCYVRPNHIPSVNAMCNESYWPGVDLSECLQYPDFSVVVLYKKVVIAFGFMVPDVKYNEAYISFLLVHPEWRRAGIATFMIYHLIQTCMGKDVTLHVSASNAAMLLYQKFGFKAEEYILDFYDKYYPVDSIECRHAFFLRLRR
ncbi:Cysteine-rich protein 2-binding protein [Dissostichus eleginoides]|uniref:Cysteine-rich protein 2-binding protein n=1 Tax=Dissostichus eleginoides TaxID=100907 RepID=A0AAD9F2F8_DISEL|nr:Cysteine-rich protein 2-binding protein [Dissostichus eleginoides]